MWCKHCRPLIPALVQHRWGNQELKVVLAYPKNSKSARPSDNVCAFALHGFPAAERHGLRPLVTPRVNPPPLVALSALGAGDLAARFAHPGWGGQAGCCLGSSSGLQGRDAPFPRANFQSLRRKQELGHDKICGTGAGAAEHPLRSSPEPCAASLVLCKSDLTVLGPKRRGGHRGLSLAEKKQSVQFS